MYAIGHFALGYLTGKGSSSLLKTKINLPLLLFASVLPDVDLIPQMVNSDLFMHRGPLHSIITFTVLMIPFFLIYRKQTVPYYAVLLSHSLIGDFFTGGVELLWPLSQGWFGNLMVEVGSFADIIIELCLFAVSTAIMFKAKDLQALLQLKPKKQDLALLVGFTSILGPLLLFGRDTEASLPALLVAPSVFWLILLSY